MKTRKVLLAFLLLICIISTSVFAISASADSENRVYATTSSTIQQGSYAYLYVYIDDLTDLASLTVSVYYDTDKVEVVSTYNSVSCSLYDSSNKDGCVQYSYIFSGEGSQTKTQLFYVYYKVKDNAEAGNTYFDIIVTDAYNSGLKAMPLSGSRCSFEVKEKTVSKSCSIYSSSTVSTSVKEEFDITYRLSTYQIASGSFYIQYDQEFFEVVSVTNGSFLNGKIADVNSSLAGSVYVSFVGTEYNTNTQLVTVRFRTIKNTSESSNIKFVSTSFYDLDLNSISCSGYTTKVNVSYDDTYVDDLPAMTLYASYSADTQETTLVIKLDKDSNLGAGDFVLKFNPEHLEYVSSTKGFAPSFFNINDKLVSEGTLKFSIISMTDITDEHIVLTIKFKSSLLCQDITPKFEINGSGLADSMTNPILLNFVGTSVLIEGVGHNLVENVTLAPTCTEPGQKKWSCTRCDYYELEEISPLGHNEVLHSAKEPTCTEYGWNDYVTCSRCDYTTYSEIAALKHVFDNSCDVDCNKCGYTRMTKHSYDQGEITKEPTTTEEGIKTYTCTVCGEKKYEDIDKLDESDPEPTGGCYIATSVYGSYDCPEVWTLRRFRDNVLAKTWYGRAFVKTYYAVSPTLVEWFGETNWFQNLWRAVLDVFVDILNEFGFENTPYHDQKW